MTNLVPVEGTMSFVCQVSGVLDDTWAAVGVTSCSDLSQSFLNSQFVSGLASTAGSYGTVIGGSPFRFSNSATLTLAIDCTKRVLTISQPGLKEAITLKMPVGMCRFFVVLSEEHMSAELKDSVINESISIS